MSACSLPGGCPDLVKVRLSDGSDGSIGQACFPSDKKLSDGEKMTSSQARFNYSIRDVCMQPAWCCPDLMKVRLSDGSIGQACFPSDKKLSDGEKMTSSQARFNYSIRDVCMQPAWWLP